MGWLASRRRLNWLARESAEKAARAEERVAELEALLKARDRELEAAYADVDAASAELESSAEAVRDALEVIDALEEERRQKLRDGAGATELEPEQEVS